MKRSSKLLFFLLLALCAAALLAHPGESAEAAREGLALCLTTVLPALFPFFVLSSLLVASGAAEGLGRLLAPFMSGLFGVGGAGALALVLGLVGGYPVGARTVASLYESGEVSREEGERLLAFCSNSGPAFFLGMCGATVFHDERAGLYLYLVHALAALLTGMLLRRGDAKRCAFPVRRETRGFSPAALFAACVQRAFAAVWNVCGFVTLFAVLTRLLTLLPALGALTGTARALLLGFFEMTGGVAALTPDRAGFLACAALMGWGGLSVHAQTLSVLEGTDLRPHRYFLGKALQAALSVPLAILAWELAF